MSVKLFRTVATSTLNVVTPKAHTVATVGLVTKAMVLTVPVSSPFS